MKHVLAQKDRGVAEVEADGAVAVVSSLCGTTIHYTISSITKLTVLRSYISCAAAEPSWYAAVGD